VLNVEKTRRAMEILRLALEAYRKRE